MGAGGFSRKHIIWGVANDDESYDKIDQEKWGGGMCKSKIARNQVDAKV